MTEKTTILQKVGKAGKATAGFIVSAGSVKRIAYGIADGTKAHMQIGSQLFKMVLGLKKGNDSKKGIIQDKEVMKNAEAKERFMIVAKANRLTKQSVLEQVSSSYKLAMVYLIAGIFVMCVWLYNTYLSISNSDVFSTVTDKVVLTHMYTGLTLTNALYLGIAACLFLYFVREAHRNYIFRNMRIDSFKTFITSGDFFPKATRS